MAPQTLHFVTSSRRSRARRPSPGNVTSTAQSSRSAWGCRCWRASPSALPRHPGTLQRPPRCIDGQHPPRAARQWTSWNSWRAWRATFPTRAKCSSATMAGTPTGPAAFGAGLALPSTPCRGGRVRASLAPGSPPQPRWKSPRTATSTQALGHRLQILGFGGCWGARVPAGGPGRAGSDRKQRVDQPIRFPGLPTHPALLWEGRLKFLLCLHPNESLSFRNPIPQSGPCVLAACGGGSPALARGDVSWPSDLRLRKQVATTPPAPALRTRSDSSPIG